MLSDIFLGVGLLLLFEGIIYAAFPSGLKKIMLMALTMSENTLRFSGLIVAILGFLLVWFIKSNS